jgi:hypothetical protein
MTIVTIIAAVKLVVWPSANQAEDRSILRQPGQIEEPLRVRVLGRDPSAVGASIALSDC